MKKLGLYILFILLVNSGFSQQVPLSSQYLMNRMVVNPAYAGGLEHYTASISYRKQWINLDGAPTTQNITIHGPAMKGKLGFGLLMFRDVIGVSKENNISGSFAYRIKMDQQKTMSFGVAASTVFSNNQWSQVTTTSDNDQAFSQDDPQYVFPDFSAGFYYKTPTYFVGLSMPMFLQHELSGTSNKYKIRNDFKQYNYLLEGGVSIDLNDGVILRPSLMTRYLPSSSLQFDFNTLVDINNKLGLGVSYRTQDAIVGMLQIHINDQIIFGYSYDKTISALQKYNNGSHELFLRYDFRYKVKTTNPRFF